MKIEIASRSDIPTMMRIERGEGYARLVGRWDAEQHSAAIDSPSCRYYLAREGDGIAGFAILQNVGSENQCVRLRRIAVQDAGRGTGSRLLRSLLKICFDDLGATFARRQGQTSSVAPRSSGARARIVTDDSRGAMNRQ